jgi:hypothetical protein
MMTEPDDGNTVALVEGESARRRLEFDKHRDFVLILLVLAIVAVLMWREVRLVDETTQNEEVRSTAVSLAAQVQAECDDPAIGVDLAICKQAEEIIEDPQNPPPPLTMGEPGLPGADAPPPTPEQVRAAVLDLIQPAVGEWFRSNPPATGSAGMSRAQIEALISDLVPSAEEIAALVPAPEDGTDGRGVASLRISDCMLIITYTDGATQNVGRVCPGRSGKS